MMFIDKKIMSDVIRVEEIKGTNLIAVYTEDDVYTYNSEGEQISHGHMSVGDIGLYKGFYIDENIIVTFIPTWYNIGVGDEVTTSGLDNVFFEGLKVGKVLSLSTSQGYQKAVVKPYYTMDVLNYFYMIKRTK